jgi:thioredoxin 2
METPVLVACPRCHAANRVPVARLTEKPQCGRCHGELFSGEPMTLDDASFGTVLERTGIPTLVDFWAPWCGPCLGFAPTFAQAARQLEPRIRLAKLDTEANPQAAARLGIRSIPTLVAFRNAREIKRISGALPLPQLLAWARDLA